MHRPILFIKIMQKNPQQNIIKPYLITCKRDIVGKMSVTNNVSVV